MRDENFGVLAEALDHAWKHKKKLEEFTVEEYPKNYDFDALSHGFSQLLSTHDPQVLNKLAHFLIHDNPGIRLATLNLLLSYITLLLEGQGSIGTSKNILWLLLYFHEGIKHKKARRPYLITVREGRRYADRNVQRAFLALQQYLENYRRARGDSNPRLSA